MNNVREIAYRVDPVRTKRWPPQAYGWEAFVRG